MTEALVAGTAARRHILGLIETALPAPRAHLNTRAPEIVSMKVKPDQIGLVIGGGGKTINGIRDVTHVDDITIEDDGSVFITGKDGSAQKAKAMIEALVKEYKAGEIYDGEVRGRMGVGGPRRETRRARNGDARSYKVERAKSVNQFAKDFQGFDEFESTRVRPFEEYLLFRIGRDFPPAGMLRGAGERLFENVIGHRL